MGRCFVTAAPVTTCGCLDHAEAMTAAPVVSSRPKSSLTLHTILHRSNAGVYVKLGQMIAVLQHLVPDAYISKLSSLYDTAPRSSYEDVQRVLAEDLGGAGTLGVVVVWCSWRPPSLHTKATY